MKQHGLRHNLTHPQQRIWYSEQLHPGTGMWNNAGTLKIRGNIDYALLEKALCLFVKENEAARLQIGVEDGVPYQCVTEYRPFSIDLMDFSARGAEKLYEWDSMQTQAPMPLVESRLFYFALIRISDEEGGFYAKFHHIISDAISMVEFTNQVIDNYQRLTDQADPAPVKRSSYIDYIREEGAYLESGRFLTDQRYWIERFRELPEPTVIKQKKTNYFSTRARRKAFVIPEALSSQIRDYCRFHRVSVFALFLSALSIYINRITNKKNITVGTPVANRTAKSLRSAFGMFVSTVPVCIEVRDDLTFAEFAGVVSNEWFTTLKHQKYPYDLMLQDLRKTHKGLDSLFDVTLSYQIGTFEKDTEQFAHEGRWHFSGYQTNSLCIHVNDREDNGKFVVDYDHHKPFFSAKEIEYIHQHLINIIVDAIGHPGKPLYMLDLMSEEEKGRILNRFNDTLRAFPQHETLVDLWYKRVKVTPGGAVAVINQGQYMTYGELDEKSSALALHLMRQGVGVDSVVGMLVERTFDYCVTTLAILKAGGAFLPIDASLPDERIAYMLRDSGADVLVASPCLQDKCPSDAGICVIWTDTPVTAPNDPYIDAPCRPNSLAYVIYTSGSTGQPKGVQIEHHSIVQFVYSLNEIWDLSEGARILCAASISFDISVMELVLAFTSGSVLVLAQDHEVNIPRNMVSLIKAAEVNVVVVTPGRMELLLSDSQGAACLAEFREIGLGGDVLSEKLLAQIQRHTKARITNFYGPTEITVCCTCTDVTHAKVPNIGKPMPNVKAYILDARRNPVPIGVPGELYIGGSGVARGYIGKPDLNSERFVDNPFLPGHKLYRTGDLARWYPLGEIEFLGRIDKQVKMRGYRIELGEIENRLLQIEGVAACVVADRTDAAGRKYLCAYLCGSPPKKSEIRAQLVRDLPSYMIPSYFMTLESLPFNASGKVDKNLLPDPLDTEESSKEDFVPPETPTEKALAGIWNEVLSAGSIGRDDSFFDIGGDSLSIVTVMAKVQQKFHVDVMLEAVYRSPYLKDYAALIDAAEEGSFRPILPAPEAMDYPVSSAQQRMWIVASSQPSSTAYNVPFAFRLSKKPDIELLNRAFRMLIERHDALRTSFVLLREEELRQKVCRKVEFELETYRCGKRELQPLLKSLVKPFELDKAPLLRAALIEVENGDCALFIDMHHIISDKRTVEILMSDLACFYRGDQPAPKTLEYKDYAVWNQEFLKSDEIKLQKDYWKGALAGELPLLNLRTDYPRGAVQRFEGARLPFRIEKQAADALRAVAAKHGATLFMAVLAVYNVLLCKYTGQEDIIVGAPSAGRPRREMQDIAGVFINTLPLRNRPSGDLSFSEFLEELCRNTVAALSNADYPLERMVADLNLQRDAARNPLFDTMLMQTSGKYALSLGDIGAVHYPVFSQVAKLDLTLEVYEVDEGLDCEMEYNGRIFKKSTVMRMIRHFCRLAELLAEAPATRLRDVAMLSQQEIWQVTQGFNQTDLPLPDVSIQSLFEAHAEKQGNKTALFVGGEKMAFAELNRRANRIAWALRERGVNRNTIVALCISRSFDMMAAILGVLKSGGAYLPLDTAYPKDRMAFMLADSGAMLLLSDGSAQIPFGGPTLFVQDIPDEGPCGNLPRIDRQEDLAYVIYTSGSTGIPKGAVLHRRGLLNLYEATKGPVDYDPDQISVCITTVSFDIFVCDALLPLLFGGTVALSTEEELRQPNLLANLIERHGAKFIQATPTRLRAMMDDKSFRAAMGRQIEKIMVGGEMVPPSLVKLLQKHTSARIINAYGPTETTVWSSFKELTKAAHVTIGRPIANTRFYMLDQYRRPVPIGVLGEAYISGDGVSLGYINRDELNRKTFLPDPYWPGHMMYKTGDVCAFLENGEMVMYGRADHQVKIRGLRIELGEIEAALRGVKGVEEAVVKDWGEGASKYLCAYYQADRQIGEEVLREHLRGKLPPYMVPSFFVAMRELPTTLNGKVNRKELQEPDRQRLAGRGVRADAGMSETEKTMAAVWSRILKVSDIGPQDSFFALGGDSLSVIKVQAAVLQYGWTIRTQDFYDHQTLHAVCARLGVGKVKQLRVGALEARKNLPIPTYSHLSPAKLKDILVTGATGYLGAHLLERLADIKDTRIYCLVRGKDDKECGLRLRQALSFYFGIETCAYIMGRVSVIRGDVSQKGLGIAADIAERLKGIDSVIHSAALTDHIGRAETFERANVAGTRHVVEFAQTMRAALLHISTVSVSGTCYADDPGREGEFTEGCYYVGQNYADNEYVKSKFLAEGVVLDAIEQGLNARIFRVGILTGTMDGRFQMRPERNAFANRIKAICDLGCVPLGMLSARVEMTPVDSCVQAILDLTLAQGQNQAVYHVFNTNTLSLGEVVSMIERNGYNIRVLSDKSFLREVNRLSKKGRFALLSGLMEDISGYRERGGIGVSANATVMLLDRAGFRWPVIDEEYVGSFLGCIGKIALEES